jgi:hypothetical protein
VRLTTYNSALPAVRRIRLRMAVHFGAAMSAENGYAGQGVVAVSRLVDSPPVREALRAAPDATLVLALPSSTDGVPRALSRRSAMVRGMGHRGMGPGSHARHFRVRMTARFTPGPAVGGLCGIDL